MQFGRCPLGGRLFASRSLCGELKQTAAHHTQTTHGEVAGSTKEVRTSRKTVKGEKRRTQKRHRRPKKKEGKTKGRDEGIGRTGFNQALCNPDCFCCGPSKRQGNDRRTRLPLCTLLPREKKGGKEKQNTPSRPTTAGCGLRSP